MDRRLARRALLVSSLAVLVLAEPATAQPSSSVTERLIWDLNQNLLYAAVPITVLVEGILLYTVIKYKDNDDPEPTRENRRLEITWTVVTALILLGVGLASYQVMAQPYVVSGGAQPVQDESEPVEVAVFAERYSWTFAYNDTGPPGERVTSAGTLVVPVDRPLVIRVTSEDWIHSFHAPGLGLKQDAMPGAYNQIQTRITEEGSYQLYCAEYCGVGHADMLAEIEAVSQSEYEQWLDEQEGE